MNKENLIKRYEDKMSSNLRRIAKLSSIMENSLEIDNEVMEEKLRLFRTNRIYTNFIVELKQLTN